MIPFNLERAKIGIPMHTRNGLKANFIAYLNGGQPAPIIVEVFKTKYTVLGESHSSGTMENYYYNGRHNLYHDTEFDLFMEY